MKHEKRHYKIHVPAPDDRYPMYCVTSTGGSKRHCFDTLDEAFARIRSNESRRHAREMQPHVNYKEEV